MAIEWPFWAGGDGAFDEPAVGVRRLLGFLYPLYFLLAVVGFGMAVASLPNLEQAAPFVFAGALIVLVVVVALPAIAISGLRRPLDRALRLGGGTFVVLFVAFLVLALVMSGAAPTSLWILFTSGAAALQFAAFVFLIAFAGLAFGRAIRWLLDARP